MITFEPSHSVLRPAEWVFPGHPDKLADAVADTLVQAAVALDPKALCAIEVAVHREVVYLTGRLASQGSDQLPLQQLVGEVYRSAGYGGRWRPLPDEIQVQGNLCLDALADGEDEVRHISDDQSIVTGYAIDLPGCGFLPPEQWLVRELARALYALKEGPLSICPDGKVLLVLEESPDPASAHPIQTHYRLRSVSASLLAPDEVDGVTLLRAVRSAVQALLERACLVMPGLSCEMPESIVVNGGGNFHIGGPEGDNGLSGKKLLLDYYGPRVPIGGSALSGKDFHKPDRAGAVIARQVALTVVQLGLATEATVQLVTFPGDEAPRVLRIATPKGDLPQPQRWVELLAGGFNSVPGRFVRQNLVELARWGWVNQLELMANR